MERCACGDHSALAALFDAIAPPLAAHLSRRVASARIDRIVRTVMLELHRRRSSYVVGTPVLPWALAIAHRLLRGQPAPQPSGAQMVECSTSSERLRDELARIAEPGRTAWELVSLDRLTPTQAGSVLGLGKSGVRNEIVRAQKQLAVALQQIDGTFDDGQHEYARGRLLERGAIALERYRIEHRVGGGAHGDVYLARDLRDGREAALKVLREGGEDTLGRRQRFAREVDIARRIDAPGLVPTYAVGTLDDGRHCYAMEYLHGRSLAQLLGDGGPLPWANVRRFALDICETLDKVHDLGVVHRDLKPGNCFLAHGTGPRDRVRLLDFGVAKLAEPGTSPLTTPGALMGTPEYMAPEQLRGEQVDGRTDLYALGITMYELLVGRRPFQGESLVSIISQQLFTPPRRPSETLGDDGLADADHILLRMLAKDPEQRFGSARELASALHTTGIAGERGLEVEAHRGERELAAVGRRTRTDHPAIGGLPQGAMDAVA